MQKFLLYVVDLLATILTSKLFWILLGIIIALVLIIIWYRKLKIRAIEKLEYQRKLSTDGVFAGEDFILTEVLHNPTWLPLISVKMEFFVPAGFTIDDIVCEKYTKIMSIFYIPPHATVTKDHKVQADIRGYYTLETSIIKYRKNEFLFSAPLHMHVYPKYSEIVADMPPDLYRVGNSISKSKYIEDPFFVSGIRKYMAGDPMRNINFKASARSFSGGMLQLMSNNYDSSRNFDSMIFLDLFNYADNGTLETQKQQLEYGLSYSCYLLSEIIKHGGSAGFSANCAIGEKPYVYIPCGTGTVHTKSILECFAKINYFDKHNYSITALLEKCLTELSRDTDIYLITPVLESSTAKMLRNIQNTGRNVCVIPLKEREDAL